MSFPNEIRTSKVRETCAVLDVALATAYHARVFGGDEMNPESAWTIMNCASSLAYQQEFSSVQDVCDAFVHRVCCASFIRRIDLAEACVEDVVKIVRIHKRRGLLKLALFAYDVFRKDELYYLLNRLVTNDLCVWLQTSVSDEEIDNLLLEPLNAFKFSGFRFAGVDTVQVLNEPTSMLFNIVE